MDDATGAFGASNAEASREKAEEKAISICDGGKKNECRLKFTYFNQCASVIAGKRWNYTQSHNTIADAVSRGLDRCRQEDQKCEIFYSACSLAEPAD